MTGMRVHRRRPLLCAAALLAALLLVLAPQSALADDPPPITVPTPAVPAPTPDTAPKRAPSPTPDTAAGYSKLCAPAVHTYAVATGFLATSVDRDQEGCDEPTEEDGEAKQAPRCPDRPDPYEKRADLRPRQVSTGRFEQGSRPGTAAARTERESERRSRLDRASRPHSRGGTTLVIPARSRRARTYLSRLVAYRVPPHVLLRRLSQSVAAARERVAKLLPDVGAANAQRLIPQGVSGRIEARLHRQALAEFVAAPVPLPAVASLEPVASLEALPEPELAPLILSTPPSPKIEEAKFAPAPPTEEICEVAVWRGYRRSRFYARLEVAAQFDEEGCAVGESTPFRFSGNGTLEQTEAAEAAYRALVEELMAQGWEPCDSRGPWYAARFSRALVALS